MTKRTSHWIRGCIFALSAAALIGGCTLPVPTTIGVPPTVFPTGSFTTPEAIYTSAVETVVAQLTQSASTQQPVIAETPTAGQIATQEATATSSQPGATTALSSTTAPTSVATVASTVAPTAQSTSAPTSAASATSSPATTTPTTSAPTATTGPTSTALASDPRQSLGTPTWQDTFANDKNWSLSPDAHTDMVVKNGKLVMTAFHADFFDGWALTIPKIANFYLEMTASPETCRGLDQYGIIFRATSDAKAGYLAGLSCDGRYSLWIWDGTKKIVLINWTTNPAIKAGPNQTNRLGIKGEGDRLTLYANGVFLGETRDSTYSQGSFGVFIGSANTPNFTTNVSELDYWKLP